MAITKKVKVAPKKTTTTKKAAKAATKKAGAAKGPGTAKALKAAMERYETKLESSEEIKLPDYVRLMQIQKDMTGETVREVTIRWVDPWQDEPSSAK